MHLIYGIHPVLELLRHDFRKIERLWITENTDSPRLKELVSQARRLGIPVHYEPKAAIRRRAGSEQHQGVVATVTAARLLEDDEVLDQGGDEALLLILDGILDPQNLGAILRTADAAGVSGIFLAERRTAPLTPAAIKASAGAAHHLRIAR
ncbi:MAG: 23S rRNA (guanosine(2251)-2'-O)-methyltransferase RlmB, partial [Acidobacteria bacterium]|nr:23S rRNA (guanosine(2251)-2'-O)-methyltransferase RlmB [Acidobacteriota bacterium]